MDPGHTDVPGQDWRSTHTAADEHKAVVTAQVRAQEGGRGREADEPADIPARGWRDILWRVIWSASEDRVLATAGSVAFFALLAIFPGLATLVSLYGLVADRTTISGHLTLLAGILPHGALDLLAEELTRVAGQRADTMGLAFIIGLLVALGSANSGVSALFDALNLVYKEREKRSLLRFYATTVLFTLGAIGVVLAAISAVIILPIVLNTVGLDSFSERLLAIVRWPALLTVVTIWLALVYRYGPSRREAKWRWVRWGSGAAALLWIGCSMLFSWYVASFDSYNRVYGSLGAGVGFMTWMWLSVVIVLMGGELNAEMEHQTGRDTTEGLPRPLGGRGAVMADHVGAAHD
jgi:membrane protein